MLNKNASKKCLEILFFRDFINNKILSKNLTIKIDIENNSKNFKIIIGSADMK